VRRINEKKLAQMRRYLCRGWRTVPAIVEHTGLSRRTVYRWLGRLWHELIKKGSRDRTEYRITD
jgi:predicted DNA-binding transcriptional regulator YafY